ncbi:hypothetical protein FN846DRAFT_681147 [Sphaerosporella brunnea]|uniref:VWFA domain-containing protein n=1 Tax=Sphaerosporella brunnea TaxID=1250544 RepID=A0A5J5EZH3_9PEZI|nr:hypothetical protein FN846DRAFT_681147 [Sphaerosporella brunnea]
MPANYTAAVATRSRSEFAVPAATVRSRFVPWDQEEMMRKGIPQMDTRPLNFRGGGQRGAPNGMTESAVLSVGSLRSRHQPIASNETSADATETWYTPASPDIGSVRRRSQLSEDTPRTKVRGRRSERDDRPKTAGNQDVGSVKSRYGAPPTPRRTSSKGATRKRSHTVEERKTDNATAYVSQLDGPSDVPERKKSSAGARGMAWLQRPEKRVGRMGMAQALREIPAPMSNVEGKNSRSFTEPARPTTADSATARGEGDMVKRATSSASRFKKAFVIGPDNSTDAESLDRESNGDKKAKGWKQRVFSKEFFKPETRAQKLEKTTVLETTIESPEYDSLVLSENSIASNPFRTSAGGSPAPSIGSSRSDRTVVTKQSRNSGSYSGTDASQAASTTEEFQVDGVGSIPLDDESTEKVFNDSVIGMLNGKIGSISRPRAGQQWKPPILTLDVQVISPIDRLPVKVGPGNEIWVAVVLQGLVVGDIDTPNTTANATGIGLDVGVLLDISPYTSPESFEEMKNEAKRLVEAMDTSKDRIAVMTFPAPFAGKANATSQSRGEIRVLNSSGSVAKRQLIDDIADLQPGLSADPSRRDVSAAVNAAIKTLHNMPSDTSKYGCKRSSHLFVITSKLHKNAIGDDPGGVKVHILGVGPIFNPTSAMGAKGWCSAVASPLDTAQKLRKIIVDGVEIPVEKPPGAVDVKSIINLLRMGIDLGVLEEGDLFFYPGEGCKLKGVLGDMAFPTLLPGERKCLMVKLEVGDLPGWDSGDMELSHAERQLAATLGELTSTLLTVEVIYRHSQFAALTTKLISKTVVEIWRYEEGCIWSRSSLDVAHAMPSFLTPEEKIQDDKARVNAVLVQVLAAHHSSARDAWRAIDQLRDHIHAPEVLRELGCQVYLEDRFAVNTITDVDPPFSAYSEPMLEAFERSFSPNHGSLGRSRTLPLPPNSRRHGLADRDLLMDGTTRYSDDADLDPFRRYSDSDPR